MLTSISTRPVALPPARAEVSPGKPVEEPAPELQGDAVSLDASTAATPTSPPAAPAPSPAAPGAPTDAPASDATPTPDPSSDLSPLSRAAAKASEVTVGVALSAVSVPVAVGTHVALGTARAAWRAAGINEGWGPRVWTQRVGLIAGGVALGAMVGSLAGPVGAVVGALAGPGALGCILCGVREGRKAAAEGIALGRRVEERLAEKWGKYAVGRALARGIGGLVKAGAAVGKGFYAGARAGTQASLRAAFGPDKKNGDFDARFLQTMLQTGGTMALFGVALQASLAWSAPAALVLAGGGASLARGGVDALRAAQLAVQDSFAQAERIVFAGKPGQSEPPSQSEPPRQSEPPALPEPPVQPGPPDPQPPEAPPSAPTPPS